MPPSRRVLLAAGILASGAAGCGATAQLGTRTIAQSADPSVAQEVNGELGAGMGDAQAMIHLVANGGAGANLDTGVARATVVGGIDVIAYGGTVESARHGNHVGLLAGMELPAVSGDPGGVVFLRYGHAWVLGVSGEGGRYPAGVSAVALDVLLGTSFGELLPTQATLGLGLSLRFDYFSEWHVRVGSASPTVGARRAGAPTR
ncbi:MAG: hypothetical protein JST00_16030 [Deltaproteobacteria bacterium]|nr:hypothetical protein [Deltaproteobacteria bacterium]